jgi:hypothetical protein
MNRALRFAGAVLVSGSLQPAFGQAAPALAPGDVVSGFEAEGIDGKLRRIGFAPGGDTVLLFFLSGCPACHKMLPLWNKAYERRPERLTVVGVLLDKEPPGFFMATPLSFPVVRSPGADFNRAFKLNRVPMTLRVAPGGRVSDVAVGPVDAMRVGELFKP